MAFCVRARQQRRQQQKIFLIFIQMRCGERESGDGGGRESEKKKSPVDFQTVGVESQTKEATSESHLHCNPSDEGARKNKIKSSKSHSARADDARLPRFSWVGVEGVGGGCG